MNGRAETPGEKSQIMDRLLDIWKRNPELRLGQLLASYFENPALHGNLMFFMEDYVMITRLENFYRKLENDRGRDR